MELIFEVRESEAGGYVGRAPGHSIVVEAGNWIELRGKAMEAAAGHFANALARPSSIRLHLVKDELIDAISGDGLPEEDPGFWIKEMEPALETPPELKPVLAELTAREPIFHRLELGTQRAEIERMMVEDYWETGASGRRYSGKFIPEEIERRFSAAHEDVWETRGFHCRKLAEDVFLLTYTLLQDRQRLTRRATIWQRTAEGWKIVYHQGTIVQER